jgi:Xaa-Pro aminopeptidase
MYMSSFQPESAPPKSATDSAAPPNLVQFMLKHWLPKPRATVPLNNAVYHRRRRTALGRLFPGEMLVIPTGERKIRAGDQFYPFRAGSDFFYLTGCHEPDCVLLLVPQGRRPHKSILFIEPNPGKTDATFFTDRLKGELWEGPRPGLPEAKTLTGVDLCLPLPELATYLQQVASEFLARILRGQSAVTEAMLPHPTAAPGASDLALCHALAEMRLCKDDAELAEMAAVVKATKRGFEDVIRALKTAKNERELETTFWARARQEGNDVGYGTIAAAGPHACTLHWHKNDGALRKRDLLLLDAGIEGHNLYTADITRTLPISGKFSRDQHLVYELVLRAHNAALKMVRPGADFMAPNQAAMAVLTDGLVDLGVLKVSAAEALKPENQFYKRYTLHNISHMLGLDVHDCAQARQETYKFGKLRPGMVLTIEPGVYFQPDDLTVPPPLRGIGVRIEDDIVVTADGYRNLSASIPTTPAAVEAWMQKIWQRR